MISRVTKLKSHASKGEKSSKFTRGGSKDKLFPPLDEYLENRANENKPGIIRLSKIIGIDLHLPILGIMKLLSLGLLLAIMFLNLYLNRDSFILQGIENLFHQPSIVNTFYFYCILYMLIGFLIAWVYNLLLNLSIKTYWKMNISKFGLNILYFILLFLLFFGIHVYLLFENTNIGLLLLFAFFLLFPILFGAVGILIKSRGCVVISLIGIICLTLIYQNSSEEIINLIIFAVLVFSYFELSDSALKFDNVYSELYPERDERDYLILNNTVTNYLIFIITLIGITALFTFLIFYSQTYLKIFVPTDVVNSVEFNSPIFLILLLILFVFIILFGKRFINKNLIKMFSDKKINKKENQ